jgi:hypothetical protein
MGMNGGVVLLIWVGSLLAMQEPPTEFPDFPANAPSLVGEPTAPVLDTPQARRYRTRLREAAAEGPNFNGHFRIVSWGCGTNCLQWAFVDLTTGAVAVAPLDPIPCFHPRIDDAGRPHWVESSVDSRLFVVYRCTCKGDQAAGGRRLYVWEEGEAKLLREECE